MQSSSFLSDASNKELECYSESIDELEVDSLDASSVSKAEMNTVARSQRRIDIKENISSKILNVIQESNASSLETNADLKVGDSISVHAVDSSSQIKSLVVEKAKPITVMTIQLIFSQKIRL